MELEPLPVSGSALQAVKDVPERCRASSLVAVGGGCAEQCDASEADFVGHRCGHPAGSEFGCLEKCDEKECPGSDGKKRARQNETEDLQ
jgi:hypothetical protein